MIVGDDGVFATSRSDSSAGLSDATWPKGGYFPFQESLHADIMADGPRGLWRRARRIPARWAALHADLIAAGRSSTGDGGCGGSAHRSVNGVLKKLRELVVRACVPLVAIARRLLPAISLLAASQRHAQPANSVSRLSWIKLAREKLPGQGSPRRVTTLYGTRGWHTLLVNGAT